jgi:hypothetical protein
MIEASMDNDNDDEREEEGRYILHCLWLSYARKVIEKAIRLYKLDDKAALALHEQFLKPGSYKIRLI